MLNFIMNYCRNKKINLIFRSFPIIESKERKWLFEDLKLRESRLYESRLFIREIDLNLHDKRIQLIQQAIDIMVDGTYEHDLQLAETVREVYKPFLK
ncbi:MAG: hypothetical protein ACE3L7_01685 [Candidatus Pristimantibacillus sp.]